MSLPRCGSRERPS
ncbi:hypothetical protein MC885_002575 [Smutsia gigantea]|nr:hypothetical protein MC885_002575 [Smutsia gigantea]